MAQGKLLLRYRRIINYSFAFFAIVFCLINIACFFITDWIYQGEGKSEWKGSLSEVTQGSDDIEEDTYKNLRDIYCDGANTEKTEALCIRFRKLYNAQVTVYLALIASTIFMILWGLSFLMLIYKQRFKILSIFFQFAALIAFLIGFLVWYGESDSVFDEECKRVYKASKPLNACSEAGPKIMLFQLLFCIVFNLIYLVYCFKIDKVHKPEDQRVMTYTPVSQFGVSQTNREEEQKDPESAS